MKPSSGEMDYGTTLYCLEVLEAVQMDSRTSGWYWGDVRGKAGVAHATAALCRKDLICSRVGPPPFRLTIKGEEFLRTHKKPWEAFLAHTDQPAAVHHFTPLLMQIPETHEARNTL
jgi:hypothetical protein